MRKVLIIVFLFLILLSVVFLSYNTYSGYTTLNFNSKHPNIVISNKESLSFDVFSNLILNLRSDKIANIKPKVIGIFYTDKIRANNKVFSDTSQSFGSTVDSQNKDQVLLYIYVSDEIINSHDSQKLIKEYTINTINFYKEQSNSSLYNLLSIFVKNPINVKNN